MIRVLDFVRSSRRRMAELATLATLTLAFAPAAYASGSSMPWETPLNSILESVQGPVAKIISVIDEWPPPWVSPDLRTCAAVCAPWTIDWLRFMRWAQPGGPESADPPPTGVDALCGLPPTVPAVDEPPVAAKLDRAPAATLWRMEPAAWAAARRTGPDAAEAAARPTLPSPAATPDAPERPAEARL